MARAVRTFTGEVLGDWGDYNNHLNEGYYGVVFGNASDGLLDLLGFSAEYREDVGGTFYTVDTHTAFESEIAIGEPIVVDTILLGADAKRLHYWHELRVDGSDERKATQEGLMLHGDIDPVKVSAMSRELVEAAANLAAGHAELRERVAFGRTIREVGASA